MAMMKVLVRKRIFPMAVVLVLVHSFYVNKHWVSYFMETRTLQESIMEVSNNGSIIVDTTFGSLGETLKRQLRGAGGSESGDGKEKKDRPAESMEAVLSSFTFTGDDDDDDDTTSTGTPKEEDNTMEDAPEDTPETTATRPISKDTHAQTSTTAQQQPTRVTTTKVEDSPADNDDDDDDDSIQKESKDPRNTDPNAKEQSANSKASSSTTTTIQRTAPKRPPVKRLPRAEPVPLKNKKKETLPPKTKTTKAAPITVSPACVLKCQAFLANDLGFPNPKQTKLYSQSAAQWTKCRCSHLYCDDLATNFKHKSAASPAILSQCAWSDTAIDHLVHVIDRHRDTCTAPQVKAFLPQPEWERYNFGDLFFGRGKWEGENYHKQPKKPGSLMEAMYIANMQAVKKHGKRHGKRSQLFQGILKKRVQAMARDDNVLLKADLPEPDTLVIHLRLGDVIDSAVESVSRMLKNQTFYFRRRDNKKGLCCDDPWKHPNYKPYRQPWNRYVRPLSYFTEQIQLAKQDANHTYTKVVLMGAAHKGQDLPDKFQHADQSCLYTHALQTYISKIWPEVQVVQRLAQPPDNDMIYATMASGFIPSGGGYSELLAEAQQGLKPFVASKEYTKVRDRFIRIKRRQALGNLLSVKTWKEQGTTTTTSSTNNKDNPDLTALRAKKDAAIARLWPEGLPNRNKDTKKDSSSSTTTTATATTVASPEGPKRIKPTAPELAEKVRQAKEKAKLKNKTTQQPQRLERTSKLPTVATTTTTETTDRLSNGQAQGSSYNRLRPSGSQPRVST